MEFTNLAAETVTVDTKETLGETPFEEKHVPSGTLERRTENENVETETSNGFKVLICGKIKNSCNRTCIIILLIVLMISTVITVLTIYVPCNKNGK